MSDEEMKEKSLKVLHFIETLVDENKDGIVNSGDVMALLGGSFHLFLKDVKKQLSEERAEKIRTGLVMVVMMALAMRSNNKITKKVSNGTARKDKNNIGDTRFLGRQAEG